jgi:ABC-type spermidine/putrescine transport system permease subunit II
MVDRHAARESIAYDPETRARLAHSLVLASLTTVVAVPMGSAFALGCRGWHSRLRNAGMAPCSLCSPFRRERAPL